MTIKNRFAKLEGKGQTDLVVILPRDGETAAQAIARVFPKGDYPKQVAFLMPGDERL